MNSKQKGKRRELEWSQYCRDHFGLADARRSQQYCGSAESQDVRSFPGTHCEVKGDERLNIYEAIEQAVGDSGRDNDGAAVPYVAHIKNRREWLVTVRASDLVAFAQCVTNNLIRSLVKDVKP